MLGMVWHSQESAMNCGETVAGAKVLVQPRMAENGSRGYESCFPVHVYMIRLFAIFESGLLTKIP